MIVTLNKILKLENDLNDARRDYVRSHGWNETCNTPGSFWMWKRDFSDVDEVMKANHPKTASPFQPYGMVMADLDLAVSMTARELDRSDEAAEPTEEF